MIHLLQSIYQTIKKPAKSIKTGLIQSGLLRKPQCEGEKPDKRQKRQKAKLGVIRVLRKSFKKH
ncbi:hypothetical protein ASF10_23805 [Flavobacterium sp. Leaf82]|nr:hypothetical protein ASF10_23805 [Flavobacterium sp. Leaf82]